MNHEKCIPFLKRSHRFDRKPSFHFMGLSIVSFHGKVSLNLRIKLCVSLSIQTHKTTEITILYQRKTKYYCPKWKNTLKLQKIKI